MGRFLACAAVVAALAGACGPGDPYADAPQGPNTETGPNSDDPEPVRTADTVGGEPSPADDVTSPPISTVHVTLDDYRITAQRSITGRRVDLSVVNEGAVPHNVVLLVTDLPARSLPTTGIRVDENNPRIRIVAKTPTLRPGARTTLAASVEAGSYILICTVPHHYVREMMVTTLTVD